MTATERDTDLWRTCVHEAAHAVTGIASGLPVSLVAVNARHPGRVTGACWSGVPPENLTVALVGLDVSDATERPVPWSGAGLSPELAYRLAGSLAVARVRGRSRPGDDGWRDRLECEYLLGGVLGLPPYSATVNAALAMVEDHTRRLLDRHWLWIEAVARELAVKHRLTGDEVKGLRPTGGSR